MALLKTHTLGCGYGANAILSGVEATIEEGQLIAMVGRNGSGKSTLLRTLAGLQPALVGTVEITQTDIKQLSAGDLATKVSVVLTHAQAIANMTVWNLVALGRYPHTGMTGRLTDADDQAIEQAIEQVGIKELTTRQLGAISDGEKQRAMIARALAQQTKLILLDEPTAYLDTVNRADTLRLLKQITDNTGRSILFSTHDLSLAAQVANHMWLVHDGRVETGNTRELIKSESFMTVFNTDSITFSPENYCLEIK